VDHRPIGHATGTRVDLTRPGAILGGRHSCHDGPVHSFRDGWNNAVRAGEDKSAQAARAMRHKGVAAAHHLQSMSDEELIAAAEARTSLSHPYHEMEMQRRLKDSIDALALETRRARWWAFWGTVAIGVLTAVIIALTVVLAVHG
jgi:hypothetical protein